MMIIYYGGSAESFAFFPCMKPAVKYALNEDLHETNTS